MSKFLRGKVKTSYYPLSRGRNDWESIKSYPYDLNDEHEQPKDDQFVKEVFEKHYYHFYDKAETADTHLDKSKFFEYRQWQHLYSFPE